MNAVFENMLTRRSFRAYSDRPISREDLALILKGACYAPSGMNRQTWQFTVLQDRARIAALAKLVGAALGNDSYSFYKPDAIVFVSNQKDNNCGLADCACAMQNIFLGAHSLGIASVWTNQMKDVCDVPEIRAVLSEMGVPEDHIIWGTAALGYAVGEPRDVPKNEGVIRYVE